jgi:hypothetical protein
MRLFEQIQSLVVCVHTLDDKSHKSNIPKPHFDHKTFYPNKTMVKVFEYLRISPFECTNYDAYLHI